MKFVIYLITILSFCSCWQAAAQTRPHPSLYLLNYGLLNPAATGVEDYGQLQAGLRRQWVGVNGAPAANWVSSSFSLNKNRPADIIPAGNYSRSSVNERGHGLGFHVYQESIGPYNTANVNLAYAYHLPLSNGAAISMGFSAGAQHIRYDVSKNIYPDQILDPAITAQSATTLIKWTPDLNAGILFYTQNFFAGASLIQIIPARFINLPGSEARYKQQWITTAGYSFDLDDGGTRLWLSGLFKTDLANPIRYDINAKVSFQNIFWVGTSYRRNDAISGLFGINITPALVCAYMYDYSMLNKLDVYSKESHELTIGYRFIKQGQNISPKISW